MFSTKARAKHDFKDRLSEIKVPTLVIGGEEDFVRVMNVNQNSNSFGKLLGEVTSDSIPFSGPSLVKISPSGEFGLVYCRGESERFYLFDLIEDTRLLYSGVSVRFIHRRRSIVKELENRPNRSIHMIIHDFVQLKMIGRAIEFAN